MERYQGVMVALSESVMKNRWSAPWWRNHDVISGLQKKPCYLGNHASQIKSYYASLSGSLNRSLRICHEQSRVAPPGGGLTITSYSVSSTTSISRKPCMVANSYYGSLTGSHGRSFRILHEKVCAAFPVGGLTMTSCQVANRTSLSRKPCITDRS